MKQSQIEYMGSVLFACTLLMILAFGERGAWFPKFAAFVAGLAWVSAYCGHVAFVLADQGGRKSVIVMSRIAVALMYLAVGATLYALVQYMVS